MIFTSEHLGRLSRFLHCATEVLSVGSNPGEAQDLRELLPVVHVACDLQTRDTQYSPQSCEFLPRKLRPCHVAGPFTASGKTSEFCAHAYHVSEVEVEHAAVAPVYGLQSGDADLHRRRAVQELEQPVRPAGKYT